MIVGVPGVLCGSPAETAYYGGPTGERTLELAQWSRYRRQMASDDARSERQAHRGGASSAQPTSAANPGIEPGSVDLGRPLSVPAPVVVIEARRGWRELGLAELWSHRELMYFFVWRDLKVRYRQTVFGALWAVMQPVLLMVVFTVSVGRLPGVGPAGVPYPLFAFAGLVPWTLFASSLAGASNSLVNAESIITKVYFPRLLLPFAAVGSFLIDFLIAMVVLVALMLYYGVVPTIAVIWLPAFTVFALVTALGVGTLLAAVNVRYRDVKYVVRRSSTRAALSQTSGSGYTA